MATFNLFIVTPGGKAYEGAAESLVAQGAEGRFGVLPHHAPMMALLRPGVMKVRIPDRDLFFAVGKAVLEVAGDNVSVLAESAARADSAEDAELKVTSNQ